MKTPKCSLLVFCALFFIFQNGMAQVTQRAPQRQDSQRMMKWNDYSNPPLSDLNLTTDQRQRMDSLGTHFETQRQMLRDNSDVDSTMRRSRMNQLRMDEERQMTQILTQDQRDKLKSWRDDQRKNRMNRPIRRDSM